MKELHEVQIFSLKLGKKSECCKIRNVLVVEGFAIVFENLIKILEPRRRVM